MSHSLCKHRFFCSFSCPVDTFEKNPKHVDFLNQILEMRKTSQLKDRKKNNEK